MLKNRVSAPALNFSLTLLACWLSAAVAMPAYGQTSEWGPIGTRVHFGYTGDGGSVALGLDVYPGMMDDEEEDSEQRLLSTASLSAPEPVSREGKMSHIFEIDLGFAEIEDDRPNPLPSQVEPELDVFYLTTGYKYRRGWRLEGSSDDQVDESWRELRWLGSIGFGIYDLDYSQRLGTYAKVAGQYAFSRHASQAIELALSYHRVSSEQSFAQIQLGYVWHLSR